jgi:hypothetical protein
MNLIEKLESYEFECEAGPLTRCADWDAIKQVVDLWVVVRNGQPIKHTSGNGGWRFTVHTTEEEATATAAEWNRERYNDQPVCTVRHLLSMA